MIKKLLVTCIFGLIGILFASAFGCSLAERELEPLKFYVLSYDPPDALDNQLTEKQVIIQVTRLTAQPPYNTTHIVYADNPHQRSKYVYHQWMAHPSDMITSLLMRDIGKSKTSDAVVATASRNPVTHRVEGTIVDFYENNEKQKWEAVLTLRLSLVRVERASRTEKIVFTNTYHETRTLAKNNPLYLARSMSTAMAAISEQFIADIHASLSRE